ncbi:helix-turn-helix domain-containing protein [Jiulongibacter sp. NS-SX5]|uniref:helix-turn-helix domain-containing protein n=1 Tax=Jiulongibacter sp. NS-SX5 TaxID=3463854 RepID=UPI004058A95A
MKETIKNKKISLEMIQPKFGSSLILKHLRAKCPDLKLSWHFHPEIELVYIPRGKGKLFISDAVVPYEQGILVLMHSNLPHRCFDFGFENEVYEEFLVQILPEKIDGVVQLFPEFEKIKSMLEASKNGVVLNLDQKHSYFMDHFVKLFSLPTTEQLLAFFEILHLLSNESYCGLDASLIRNSNVASIDRIDKVFAYLEENFMNDIRSEDVAKLLNFTNSSFCRFFKKQTLKTFKEALTEYRIAHAAKLLTHSDKSMETIAYESGFGSQPYFNKMFKRKNGQTPLQYRSQWKKSL